MAAPLFLLAPPRSYTSLMNAMLGQHPQAFGLPELCLFNVTHLKGMWVRESDEMENHAKTRQGLLRAVAEIYAGEQTTNAITMAHHWCIARQNWSVADVYRELVDQIDPLVSVEKSPSYTISVQRMADIYAAFPNARFLHLTRHPIGQAKSVMAMNDGAFALYVNSIEFLGDRATVEPQFAWHDLNVNILNFLATVPAEQQMRIRGEDIMGNPRYWLAEVCRWLGLRDDEEAVDQMMRPEQSPFACFGPITALFGNDPNFLAGPTFRPHTVKNLPLDGPVPWRKDGRGLRPEVIELAKDFGYGDAGENFAMRPIARRHHRIGPIDGNPVTTHPNFDALTPEQRALRAALLFEFKEKKVKDYVGKQIVYLAPEAQKEPAEDAIAFLFDEHGRPPANAPIEDIIDEGKKIEYSIRWLEAILVQLKKRYAALQQMESDALDRLSESLPELPATEVIESIGETAIAESPNVQVPVLEDKNKPKGFEVALQEAVTVEFKSKKLKKLVEKSVTNIHTNVMIAENVRFLFDESGLPPADTPVDELIEERRRIGQIAEWVEAMLAQVRGGLVRLKEIESEALAFLERGYLRKAEKKSKGK